MSVEDQKFPLYVNEGSVERGILDEAEKYFTDRDERLRFDLVKRVFQWMLDTNENGWFENATLANRDLWHKGYGIRESHTEMKLYLYTLLGDVRTNCLTGEVEALKGYIDQISETIPHDYRQRYEFVKDTIYPEERLERLRRIGQQFWNDDDDLIDNWKRI